MNLFAKLKDGVDFIDKIPSTPALIIGVIIGSLIPFKLLALCVVAVAIWAAVKFLEF